MTKNKTMIVLRQSVFSKKPKGLKKYKNYDGSKMTKAQQRAAIEEEGETADYNTSRYQIKHGGRGALIGAGAGAAIGTGLSLAEKNARKAGALGNGLAGAAVGALGGFTIGTVHGKIKADKEGHNRDRRETRLARRFDDDNAKRGIDSELEYQTKRNQSDRRREELDRERNAALDQIAWNSWR